jgi:hypothetical protein
MKSVESTGHLDFRRHLNTFDKIKKQLEQTKRKSEKMMYQVIGKTKKHKE